ncbi:MAG: endonuclease/exonuclease/phosphatase family protein [Thermaurantimonas sp.]|uniref:endonuclease/exonuclease/phosphatase family protein n=1 Tax=Thermaurantimonas sp. TaxID=2681568 RepID=UPI00391B9D87
MDTVYYLAWWNLENLLDVENADRPEWRKKKIGKYIIGWNEEILLKKIRNIASAIAEMNNGSGPDIIGVCEVENERLLHLLADNLSITGRKYSFIHFDSNDKRGIDIAFLYDATLFEVPKNLLFTVRLHKRSATRDLLQAEFITNKGQSLIVIGNHWPSRTGGQYETEPFRIMAAETLSYWLYQIAEKRGNDQPVLVMGDFNDEPFSRSITEYALSTPNIRLIKSARKDGNGIYTPYLLNLLWNEMADGKGTYLYRGKWSVLDQIMVNRAVALNKGFTVLSAGIYDHPDLMTPGLNASPKAFGAPSKARRDRKGNIRESYGTFWSKGYSDHLPVVVLLKEN